MVQVFPRATITGHVRPAGGVPAASAAIEKIFLDYFAAQGLPTEPTA